MFEMQGYFEEGRREDLVWSWPIARPGVLLLQEDKNSGEGCYLELK